MAEFELVDLTVEPNRAPVSTPRGTAQGLSVGHVDTTELAAGLERLREDLAAHIQDTGDGLRLSEVRIKLTLTAEGKVAFVAKGALEACIEVVFARPGS